MAPMKRPAAAQATARKRPAVARKNDGKSVNKTLNFEPVPGKLPVSTLCGFLGAGKTTLLKHILECKHREDGAFRCAVIVNDMAELNIDASLIDYSGLIQSEDMVALQNGCVCCTLQNDLVTQILELAKKKYFHYMIIEASGVSEPSQIAKLFEESECADDHDHTKEESHSHEDSLAEHARLDTCVTVVDSADFFKKFEAIQQGSSQENFPQLLAEQIEYANVVILNKTDLVTSEQTAKVTERITDLNEKAKILTSQESKVDVMEVVNTALYKAEDFKSFHIKDGEAKEDDEMKDCCKAKVACGELPCCRSKRTIDSGKSKVVLAHNRAKNSVGPRHALRFGITSFIYQARRPFHPVRFRKNFVERFFICPDFEDEDENRNAKKSKGKGKKKLSKEEKKKQEEDTIKKQQEVAEEKQKLRTDEIGDLYRSKGFFWIASSHDHRGVFSQAGSVATVNFAEMWNVFERKAWEGTESEMAAIRKDWVLPWGDRRQDLVFIGKELKHEKIQAMLDDCILSDDELFMFVNQPSLFGVKTSV